MADNVSVKPSTDIDAKPVRSEEIGGIQHQWTVPVWGPLGTANRTDIASGKPLPIQLRSAGGLIPIGEPTDAKAAQTDATSVSIVSILKQLSDYLGKLAGAVTSTWLLAKLTDGTNAVSVKAASTAPLPTDAALVVAISPNSVNPNGQAVATASAPVVISDYGKTKVVDVTLSLDTSALGAGDVAADTQAVDAALRVADGTGILQSLMLIDQDDQKAACTIFILGANQSLGTENSAPDMSDTEALDILGIIEIGTGDYKDLGGVSVVSLRNLGIPLKAASGTDDIYVAMLNGSGTPTYTASGVKLRLGILQD